MTSTKIRGNTQIIADTITNTEINSAAGILTSKLADSPNFIMRGGGIAFTGDQSMGGHVLTNLGTPTNAGDAAPKSYVDAVVNGLDWKPSVRAATTAAGTLASSFANGSTIDGVTLATGDRILIKNQATASENGIYIVAASGAPTRATDADSSAEVTAGMAMFISEGTTLGDSQWMLTTNDPITLGTTSLTFAQIGGSTTYTGSNGVQVVGTVISPVYGSSANTVTQGNDSRLSDARTPVGTALTSGQIFVGSAGNVVAAVAMSGDATIIASGAITVNPATVVKTANYVVRETPSGTINGSNTAFTLANTPVSGTEHVYLNGILQDAGAGNDYTISTNTITMLTAPATGDKLRVSYLK